MFLSSCSELLSRAPVSSYVASITISTVYMGIYGFGSFHIYRAGFSNWSLPISPKWSLPNGSMNFPLMGWWLLGVSSPLGWFSFKPSWCFQMGTTRSNTDGSFQWVQMGPSSSGLDGSFYWVLPKVILMGTFQRVPSNKYATGGSTQWVLPKVVLMVP